MISIKYFLLCAALALLASCRNAPERQNQQSGKQQQSSSTALKIVTLPTMDCLPIFIGVEDSCFKKAGVDIVLLQRNAQLDGDTLIAGGYADGIVSDLIRTERLQRMGTPLKYVAATNATWQLIANRTARVKNVAQLSEKMIAITRFSATEYLADLAIQQAKPKGDVFKIQINDVTTRLRMLLNNEMDAMLLPEPQATTARLWKNSVLMDTQTKDIRLGVIAFGEKVFKDKHRKEQVDAFVEVYNQMCDSINKNGVKHYPSIISKHMGVDEKTIQALPNMKYKHASQPRLNDLERAKQ